MTRFAYKIESGYGRLYVSGPHAQRVAGRMPGAALNKDREAIELSMTLETLRALRERTGESKAQFAVHLAEPVMRWAKYAGETEKAVKDLHVRMAAGYRTDLPWEDYRAHTPAPQWAEERDVYTDDEGVRRWKYRTPYAHQMVMGTAACELDGVAYLCQVGTGKTRSGSEALAYKFRQGVIRYAVVVCTKNAMGTWCRQLPEWTGMQAIRLDGSAAKRKQLIREAPEGSVLVINYEMLHKLKDELAKLVGLGVILDEMHRIKNPQAQMTRAANALALKAVWRVGMTGTPVANGAQDVWSQWYFVDLGLAFGANYVQFKREFFTDNPYTMKLDPVAGALDEIGMRMQLRGLRFRKADCLDLPPQLWRTDEFDMTPAQARAYKEMAEQLLTQFSDDPEDAASAQTQLVAYMRLAQITSGFVPHDAGHLVRFDPNPKLDLLVDLLTDELAQEQVLVWAWFRPDQAAIMDVLRRKGLDPIFMGSGKKGVDNDAAEDAFQAGKHRILVTNQASGGESRTLTAASTSVYYSQNFSLLLRDQSEGRNHRPGSERHNSVLYIDLHAKNTIDGIIRSAHLNKAETARVVVDVRRHLEASL